MISWQGCEVSQKHTNTGNQPPLMTCLPLLSPSPQVPDIMKINVLASISLALSGAQRWNRGCLRSDSNFTSIFSIYFLVALPLCPCVMRHAQRAGGERRSAWVCVWKREIVISQDVSEVISFFSEPSKVCHLAITPCQAFFTSRGLLHFTMNQYSQERQELRNSNGVPQDGKIVRVCVSVCSRVGCLCSLKLNVVVIVPSIMWKAELCKFVGTNVNLSLKRKVSMPLRAGSDC